MQLHSINIFLWIKSAVLLLISTMIFSLSGCSGNNKPIPKELLFNVVRDLDIISTDTVQEYLKSYSKSYCAKVTQYARVLSNALDSLVES